MGVTPRDRVEGVLGTPTSFNDDELGSSVQYWCGNATIVDDLRIVLLRFDDDGIFDGASLTYVPYPQCWRDQELVEGAWQ